MVILNPFFTLQSPIEAVRVLLLGIIETFASNKVHIYILHLNLLSPPRYTLCSMSTSTRRILNRPNPRQCILRRRSFQQDRIPSPRIWLTYLKRDNISTTRHLFNLSVDERYRLCFWNKKTFEWFGGSGSVVERSLPFDTMTSSSHQSAQGYHYIETHISFSHSSFSRVCLLSATFEYPCASLER